MFKITVWICKKNTKKKIICKSWKGVKVEIKEKYYWNCCLKPSQGFGPLIEPQPTRWQYPLINYPVQNKCILNKYFFSLRSSMISSVKSCFFTVFSGLVKSFGSLEVYCFVNGFRLCKILRGLLIHCCCSGRGCEYLVVFWQICKRELNN